ncbi:LacI family DNA-binding transcriptional regulator [Streptomyces sp. HMX112]
MSDPVRRAVVSVATVWHVVNGTRYVRRPTRDAVRAAMEEPEP